jgi:hypothetical protein
MDRGIYFAHAFARTSRQEESQRVSLEDACSRAWAELQNKISRIRVVATLDFVEQAEQSLREQYQRAVLFASEAVKLCHSQAQLQAIMSRDPQLIGSEMASRREIWENEKIQRAKIIHQLHTKELYDQNASLALAERNWRTALANDAFRAFSQLHSAHAGAFLRFIQSPLYGDSEPTHRLFHELCEQRLRLRLSVRSKSLRVAWSEAWSRLSIRLEHRTLMEFMREARTVMEAEEADRESLRRIYDPVSTDIRERVADRALRVLRRANKIEWLKAMRMREIARLQQEEEFRDEYVLAWRLDELGRVLGEQDHRLALVADHAEDPESYERLSEQYKEDMRYLTNPATSFREITAYHSRLCGFDTILRSVEAASPLSIAPLDEPQLTNPTSVASDSDEGRMALISRAIAVSKSHWDPSVTTGLPKFPARSIGSSPQLMLRSRSRDFDPDFSPSLSIEASSECLPEMDGLIEELSSVHSQMLRQLSV